LQLDASTLSRNLERMRAQGWLEAVHDEDGRAQPFRLTPRGKRLIDKAFAAWAEGQRRAEELLGKDGLALLDRATRKARQPKTSG
jgi:DNA-binding MarR family transcriptional regulator